MRTIKTNWMKLGVHGVANVLLWYCQEMRDEVVKYHALLFVRYPYVKRHPSR